MPSRLASIRSTSSEGEEAWAARGESCISGERGRRGRKITRSAPDRLAVSRPSEDVAVVANRARGGGAFEPGRMVVRARDGALGSGVTTGDEPLRLRCLTFPQFIPRSASPDDFPVALPEGKEVFGNGGAAIVEPTWGEVIAGPLYGEEGMVLADCDLREGLRAKRWFDAAGHYRRIDVLGELVARPGHGKEDRGS